MKMKRILSFLLVMVMALNMLSMPAFAAEKEGTAAALSQETHSITYVFDDMRGTVTGPSSAKAGDTVNFSISCGNVYVPMVFITPDDVVSEKTGSFIMPDADVTVRVNFLLKCTIQTVCNPEEGGTAELLGEYPDGLILEGDVVTVKATPNEGYLFTEWTDGNETVSSQPFYTFKAEMPRQLTANFTKIPKFACKVTLKAGQGYGSDVVYESAEELETVKPYNGGFWTQDGLIIFTLPECPFDAPEGKRFSNWIIEGEDQFEPGYSYIFFEDSTIRNITVTAVWEDIPEQKYTITFDPNGGSGKKDPITLPEGSVYTLPPANTFSPPKGTNFECWEVRYAYYSEDKQPGETIVVDSDIVISPYWNYTYTEGKVKVLVLKADSANCTVTINGKNTMETSASQGESVEIAVKGKTGWIPDFVDLRPYISFRYGLDEITGIFSLSYIQPSQGSVAVFKLVPSVKIHYDLNGGTALDGFTDRELMPDNFLWPSLEYEYISENTIPPSGKQLAGFQIIEADGTVLEYDKAAIEEDNYYIHSADITIKLFWEDIPVPAIEFTDGTQEYNSSGYPVYVYSGDNSKVQHPSVTIITQDGKVLEENTDYYIVYTNNDGAGQQDVTPIKPGNYSMVVSGWGIYENVFSFSRNFVIREARKFTIFFNQNKDDGSYPSWTTYYDYEGNIIPEDRIPKYTYEPYVIGGWYTDAACSEGKEFAIDKPLTGRVEEGFSPGGTLDLYIKWVHKHPLTAVPAKDATCEEAGNIAYWICPTCGTYYNNDAGRDSMEIHLEDTVLPALGHAYGDWTVIVPATCEEEGVEAKICANDESHKETRPIAALGHTIRNVPAVEATVEKEGNIEYWICDACGKCFSDENGENEIPAESVIIPKKEIIKVKSISLKTTSLELPAGKSQVIEAEVLPENATDKEVIWKSSNTDIASVDGTGKVTGRKMGRVTVTAQTKDGGFKASCEVHVLFSDVTNPNLAAYKAIYWGADNGYVNGYGSYFDINGKCTRAQFVLFLWRTAGKPKPKSSALKFKDAADIEKLAADYKKAILWGSENGIVAGYTSGANAGKFKPNDPCTRGQVVTFLWRYKGQKPAKSGAKAFSDVPKTHKYYKAIMWASSYGIAGGFSDGTFRPDETCTRGQCVTFLYRMMK